MKNLELLKLQTRILDLVAKEYPQIYLMGGTALSIAYDHRRSEDLDFFSQKYTRRLHQNVVRFIKSKTGFSYKLINEETRKKYVRMAVYEFKINETFYLKVDFVRDYVKLIRPRMKNGMASVDDIYYRKMLAVIGWKEGQSAVGRVQAGGRQKAKDFYDMFYLSKHVEPLSKWFPKYYDKNAYARLASWYLSIPKERTVFELLDLVENCNTREIIKELDEEIIHKLNKVYAAI